MSATIRAPASMAMLDCLAEGPRDWAGLTERAAAAIKGKGGRLDADEVAAMAGDARLLWRYGLLSPLYVMQQE